MDQEHTVYMKEKTSFYQTYDIIYILSLNKRKET